MRELPNINKPLIFLLDLYLYLFSSSYSVLEKKKRKREKNMRIRKNAKLSPLWFSHASAPESLQAHVCQLNQSPWDVLPLTHQVLFSFTFFHFLSQICQNPLCLSSHFPSPTCIFSLGFSLFASSPHLGFP